ncbi:Protein SEB-3, partial [Aphelenchoides avenae]
KPLGPHPCNGCGSNMTCFIMTEYQRTMKQSRAKFMERTFEDTHIFPQSWRCHFYRDLSAFELIRYSSNPSSRDDFMQQFTSIAISRGVNQSSLDFIADQLKSGRVVHSTVQSAARKFFEDRLRSSPFLMEFVVRMYYWDFALFGYDVPRLKLY